MQNEASLAITPLIEAAWSTRFSRDIENCRTLVASLRQRMSFLKAEVTLSDLESLFGHFARSEVVGLVCLVASLQRADGAALPCAANLEMLAQYFSERGWSPPFQLCFQKGLVDFAEARYSTALDLFLASKSAAENALEQAYALCNALFCLEALGMPCARTKTELLAKVQKLRGRQPCEDIVAQLEAFELRTLFRAGHISALKKLKSQSRSLRQADYYMLWVAELPYHALAGTTLPEEKEEFFLSPPSFYLKGYRVRTLQGLLHADDLGPVKETELADRIYLWTWRWLTGSGTLSIPKIMALFRHVDFSELASRLTSEDYQLIRNSLLWLGLFDANSAAAVQKLTEALRPVHAEDFPIFAFEKDVVSYLAAVRDHREEEARDLRVLTEANPLWKRDDLFFADLVTSVNKPGIEGPGARGPLKNLVEQIREFNRVEKSGRWGSTVVDLKSFEIRAARLPKKVVSQPLCYAIESLFRKNPLEFEELMRTCFGIAQYDPLSHASKVFNLIARMKMCLPKEMTLTSKGGKLYVTGSWQSVQFIRPHVLASALQDQPEWRALIRRRVDGQSDADQRWIKPAQILKKLSGQPTLKRHELETLTGKSRSTANRIISRWLAQGILKKSGRAKNTVYSFHSPQLSAHKKI